ncbi:MAG: discoidin domain-containing protein [Armatimonadetes bacterium]|nr:discoidin domain-containing protein [Armatimonadota bacterium]
MSQSTTPTPPAWQDQNVVGINKLPPRTTPVLNLNPSLKGAPGPVVTSLDGIWKFNWVGSPNDRPLDFWKADFDDSDWFDIKVPGCMETQGFGIPIYTNVRYPHPATPPTIDDKYNPVGSYRTSFDAPEGSADKRTILRFDGVYSGFNVWLNGTFVGYSEDSTGPAEFDVTKLLKAGKNQLSVEVFRWTDGSYLEDQDMFRFSGIFRPVKLLQTAKQNLWNVLVEPGLAPDLKSAAVAVKAELDLGGAKPEGYQLRVDLKSPSLYGRELFGDRVIASITAPVTGTSQTLKLSVPAPDLWSAERPVLYRTVVTLLDQDKNPVDARETNTGFRRMEWGPDGFKLNGKYIKLKGVNRHEADPDTGKTLTYDRMEQDIRIMKSFNINTVRCSHYMNDAHWYELCDMYGVYVVDEANIESHGMGYSYEKSLGNNPTWQTAHLDRTKRLVECHRNYPSIIMWSMGNEAGPGVNFAACSKQTHELDPTRPVHYERDNGIADVDSVMYPGVDWLMQVAKSPAKKPFFVCEYAHSMGNALGNFAEYWEAFEASDHMMGGCIWDFVDQGLHKYTDAESGLNGKRDWYYGYGGDYDDHPNDGPFCNNGIILPDRQITPKIWEVKKIYQNAEISMPDPASSLVRVRNKFYFTDLSEFEMVWQLSVDGAKMAEGSLGNVPIAPGETKDLTLPLPMVKLVPGTEAWVRVALVSHKDLPWAKSGWEAAWQQLEWRKSDVQPTPLPPLSGVELTNGTSEVKIAGPDFTYVLSKTTGTFSAIEVKGKAVVQDREGVASGPLLNVFRAFTDNDIWFQREFWDSGLGSMTHRVRSVNVEKIGNNQGHRVTVSMDCIGFKGNGFRALVGHTFAGDGSCTVDYRLSPVGELPPLPRVGVLMRLTPSFDNLQWLGRGPLESYPDRKHAMDMGLYSGKVSDQFTEYVRPQENGNKEDTRWLELTDEKGIGLLVTASGPLSFTASHFTPTDLDDSRHESGEPRKRVPLVPRKEVILCLDHDQMGLGGASCGPSPLEQYVCHPGEISFRFVLRPAGAPLKRAVPAVPLPPTITRGSDGIVRVSSTDTVALTANGKAVTGNSVNLASGGTVEAVAVRDGVASVRAVAKFEAIDPMVELDRSKMTVEASSFEPGEGEPQNVLDGNPGTFWHSRWSENPPSLPQSVTVDLGAAVMLKAIAYSGRNGNPNGRAEKFELETSSDGKTWSQATVGSLKNSSASQLIKLDPRKARYVRFTTLTETQGRDYASIAELQFFSSP